MVDVVTEFAREHVLGQLLYVDDLVLLSKTIDGLRNILKKWKEVFESQCLKVFFGKPKVLVNRSITMIGLSKNEVCLCEICNV